MTKVIYEPTGKAREYSPLALNVYTGCTHGCAYCYAPRCMKRDRQQYYQPPAPRKGIADLLRRQLAEEAPERQVLLSFIGDCFCETLDHSAAALECLDALAAADVPTAILTKGGRRLLRAERQIAAFAPGRVAVGATLTMSRRAASLEWEPGAALPEERVEVLRHFHGLGVRTFASFEPVLDPVQSLEMIRASLDCVDLYKVGKLNNHPLEHLIDWRSFLREAVAILRGAGKEFYVKVDLRNAAPDIVLTPDEADADVHMLTK